MTSARFQPFCGKHIISIGYYDVYGVYPRNIKEKHGKKMHKNLFCLLWKSNSIIFSKTIEELKNNPKVVDSVISDKHVKGYVKNEYKPKKVQSQLTNKIVHDLETFKTDKAVPCANCIYRLSKSSGTYHRDIPETENEKCNKIVLFLKD